jgi:Bacterial mobilisation protein (MobC)
METVSKIKKKTGRPAKAIKKEIRACVRFSRHEYFIIKEKARHAGVNASEFIRQTAIKAKIITRIKGEELHFVRQLVGMSTNLNQVAKVCNREGMFEAMQYF